MHFIDSVSTLQGALLQTGNKHLSETTFELFLRIHLIFVRKKNRLFFSSLSCRYSSRGVVNAMHSLGGILLHPKEVTT